MYANETDGFRFSRYSDPGNQALQIRKVFHNPCIVRPERNGLPVMPDGDTDGVNHISEAALFVVKGQDHHFGMARDPVIPGLVGG